MPHPVRRPSCTALVLLALGVITGLLASPGHADGGSAVLQVRATPPGTPPPGPDDPSWPQTEFRPDIVQYGEPVTLAVRGNSPGARTDAFLHTPRRVVAFTDTLDADGTASWTFPGTSNAFVQARVGDVWNTDLLPLRVIRRVTLGVREKAGTHRFHGVTSPGTAGLQVTVGKVLADGRTIGIGASRTDAAGAYTVTVRLRPGTSLYYVVTPSTDDLVGAHSRLYGIRVARR